MSQLDSIRAEMRKGHYETDAAVLEQIAQTADIPTDQRGRISARGCKLVEHVRASNKPAMTEAF